MMTHPSLPTPDADSAVLISGGLDSAILAGLWARERIIQPIYVHCGLFWEQEEITHCRLFLEAISSPHVLPLIELHQPANDLYGAHWSLSGTNGPGHDTPDEAVFLPGRNVLLLSTLCNAPWLYQMPGLCQRLMALAGAAAATGAQDPSGSSSTG